MGILKPILGLFIILSGTLLYRHCLNAHLEDSIVLSLILEFAKKVQQGGGLTVGHELLNHIALMLGLLWSVYRLVSR